MRGRNCAETDTQTSYLQLKRSSALSNNYRNCQRCSDAALYPRLQRGFVEADPRITLHVLERSGSFSHVEETATVLGLVREFLG